jgi:hypothetical protein
MAVSRDVMVWSEHGRFGRHKKTVISENSQVADQPVPNVVHFALDQAVLS